MHDTAYRIGGLVMDTYLPSAPARILEIGALNVNGTLRDHCPRNAEYTGLDFEAGEGVDVVITGLDDWNVPDAHFDLVMASSVFEHDSSFWRTFLAMCKKTRPGGHIYVSAPSNGTIHRYPRDCWRFYPDAGVALEEWARAEAFEITLIESFVAEREADGWNDFCAIFRLEPSGDEINRNFVYEKVRSTNARNWRTSLIINAQADPEDARLLRTSRDEGHALHETVRQAREEGHAAREQERARFEAEEARLRNLHATEIEARMGEISDLTAEVQARMGEISDLTAEVQARMGEISDLTGEVEKQKIELSQLSTELDRLRVEAQAKTDFHEDQTMRLRSAITELENQRENEITIRGSLSRQLDELANQKSNSEQRLQERFREIAGITRLIRERDQAIAAEHARVAWLLQVASILTWSYSKTSKARLATWLPAYFSHKRQKSRLKQQGLFDADAYSALYPDVSRSGADPFRHYINHGIKEGRIIRQEP